MGAGQMRALLALVIVMGVLILGGTAGLVAVVVHRLAHPVAAGPGTRPGTKPGTTTVPPTQVPLAAVREEPAGTHISALVRQSDTVLAIALTGGGPDRVLVWDMAAGRAVAEIRLQP